MFLVPFRGYVKKGVLVPRREYSFKTSTVGAFAVPFRILRRKRYGRRQCVGLELVPLCGEETLEPSLRNKTLVPLRASFEHFHEHSNFLFMGIPWKLRAFSRDFKVIEVS